MRKVGMVSRVRAERRRSPLLLLAVVVAALLFPGTALGAQPVSGVVFNDYNANGARNGGAAGVARDDGVGGVTVRAYGPGGGQVASATTAADGTYTLQVPDGVPRVRVEFTGFPAGYLSGPHGADSGTSVQFVDLSDGVADTTVSLGIAVPEDYCANNPMLASACFRFGPAIAGTSSSTGAVVMGFPYDPSGEDFSTGNGGVVLATHQQIGAVYGLGFDARTGDLYAGAYFKVHTGFGTGGPGEIYRIPFNGTGYGAPVPWAALPATTNLHTTSTNPQDWVADNLPASFDGVGKTGLGDVEVAADGSELYAVNLQAGTLITVPLGGASGTPGPGVPIPAPSGCPAGDWRPFGLGVHRGTVYVGGVCSNQSGQSNTTPTFAAYVWSYNPANDTFGPAPVLSFPLNPAAFPRKCANDAGNRRGFPDNANLRACPAARVADWHAWVNAAQAPNVGGYDAYPQPMLSDIAFDGDAMVLGMRDRFGDQMGNQAYGPKYPANTSLLTGLTAGDLLRACPGGPGWVLESNGSCGGRQGLGPGNAEGPGGGEFYSTDDWIPHDQLGLGGVAQVPGFDENVTTMFDPLNPPENSGDAGFNDGGVVWSENATGGRSRNGFRLYNDNIDPAGSIFGKANGLGDLEARCRQAPLEIGNRVWLDTNRDGVQGAETDEPAIPGVVVELWSGGTKVTETTTDARGEYYFPDLNPNADYQVRIDRTQPALAPYTPTGYDQGGKDTVDSDGRPSGSYVIADVRTGGPGDNDHTFDFGFYEVTDVQVVKRASVSVARIGEEFVYTVRVVNNGPGIARNVEGSDTLPDLVRYISLNTTKGTCTGERTITCRFGDLDVGESATVVVHVQAVKTGSTRNVAVVTTDTPDTKPPNNTAVTPPAPRVIVGKRAARRIMRSGRKMSYRIVVRNVGTGDARNVRVCDRLGLHMRFVSTPRGRRTSRRACWRVAQLDRGQRRTYMVVARADRIGVFARSTNMAISRRSRARARVAILPVPAPPVTG